MSAPSNPDSTDDSRAMAVHKALHDQGSTQDSISSTAPNSPDPVHQVTTSPPAAEKHSAPKPHRPRKATWKVCSTCTTLCRTLRSNPSGEGHSHSPDDRACGHCWEGYISTAVEDQPDPRKIECMFCRAHLDLRELETLARVETWRRLKFKLNNPTKQHCHARCAASRMFEEGQPHDRTLHGRVFTCAFCGTASCTSCSRLEHTGESCAAYEARVERGPAHAAAEAATKAAYRSCPSCGVLVELHGVACGHVRCEVCKAGFCGYCWLPWAGSGGSLLCGREAHGEGCRYRERKRESRQFGLENRWVEDEEGDGAEVERLKRIGDEGSKAGGVGEVVRAGENGV